MATRPLALRAPDRAFAGLAHRQQGAMQPVALNLSNASSSAAQSGASCLVKPHARPSQQRQLGRLAVAQAASPNATSSSTSGGTPTRTARETALAYYTYYNEKKIDRVLELIAEDCEYEDLIYEEPFVGREQVAAYFAKIEKLVPKDIKFCVEDITDGDPRRCGVRWHVEIADESGRPTQFPFSRGVSFYEVNDQGQIVFARDIVEPAIKPGAAALGGISVVAPLVRKLGPNADPAVLKTLPIASGAMWLFYFSYIGYVMLSTTAPGLPAWQTSPETLAAVLHESLNYFYINIGLSQLGLSPVPCIAQHPVSEALFNFVNAWSLMFWPVMLADPRGKKVKNRFAIWVGTQFLTNVFLPIYLAQRLAPDAPAAAAAAATPGSKQQAQAQDDTEQPGLPSYAPVFGAVAATVGVVSIWWALAARPEAGDLAARWEYLTALLSTSRVDWAFAVDASLYSVWQAWLLGAAGAAGVYRFVPFFGMAAWLVAGTQKQQGKQV